MFGGVLAIVRGGELAFLVGLWYASKPPRGGALELSWLVLCGMCAAEMVAESGTSMQHVCQFVSTCSNARGLCTAFSNTLRLRLEGPREAQCWVGRLPQDRLTVVRCQGTSYSVSVPAQAPPAHLIGVDACV